MSAIGFEQCPEACHTSELRRGLGPHCTGRAIGALGKTGGKLGPSLYLPVWFP